MTTAFKSLVGKIALVTGAGSGIGRATAAAFAREGAIVGAADLDLGAAESCVSEIAAGGGMAFAIGLDVTDETAWRRTIDLVVREHGRLDVMVNSAGVSISKPVADLAYHEWKKVLAVNLDGAFLGAKYAVAAMTVGGGGSIVNVASVSGLKPYGGASAYCASKAALRMFSKAVAIECSDAKTGVRVNVVSPGGVKTPMWEKEEFFRALIAEHGGRDEAYAALSGHVPSQRFFSAAEVADTILFLTSDAAAHLSGTEIVMDRGHSA